jgi:protein TonB
MNSMGRWSAGGRGVLRSGPERVPDRSSDCGRHRGSEGAGRMTRVAGIHGQRGAISPQLMVIGAIALALIVVVILSWWVLRSTAPPPPAASTTAANAPTEATPPPPAPVTLPSTDLSVDQLYQEARKAMTESRIAMPAGNNALEYYLQILVKDPSNAGAMDALRELFPFATSAAEDQINQGELEEANRIIEMLAKADPENYSLTILRGKLDGKRKLAQKEQALAAARQAQQRTQESSASTPVVPADQQTAATSTAEPAATASPGTAQPAVPPPAESSGDSVAAAPANAATSQPAAAAPSPSPPVARPAAPAAGGETRDVAVLSPPAPQYPAAAARSRQQGWVDLEFTVGPDGSVQRVRVIDSQPSRVFDQAAINAVQKAKFSPRLENGQPVSSTLRRRIEFKM